MAQPLQQRGHGPLPYLLLALTFVTGLVDAVSFFRLDHVFVANMTGNVLFLAFAIADARDFSITASSLALASFVLGAAAGGRCANLFGQHRARYLAVAMTISIAAFAASTILIVLSPSTDDLATRYLLIGLLGVAMGNQNGAARRLAVPDLNTTVLTMTLTSLASESRLAGGAHPRPYWRLASVATMFVGAALGAALVLTANTAIVIGLAFFVAAAVEIVALRLRRSAEPWTAGAG
jgi:uncharacterized membrane protein YoaK (UPF0700 family)